ncbi:MAG: hypothetical protein RI568_16005 [Natronomonas sp.]|uniref:hypothetical protein n=1 Tax=Natronomonas sp. TaxID=2184060 RepID=UPI002870450D|nr:hypothetical protein [Natronomonas sp.]MDR9432184.1 hypothetical protein [Natronomonas sp.]
MIDDERTFATLYAEWTEDTHGHRMELNAPDEFGREEWDSLGYMPPERRSRNEEYGWSKFYDFFMWLRENGYLDESAIRGRDSA